MASRCNVPARVPPHARDLARTATSAATCPRSAWSAGRRLRPPAGTNVPLGTRRRVIVLILVSVPIWIIVAADPDQGNMTVNTPPICEQHRDYWLRQDADRLPAGPLRGGPVRRSGRRRVSDLPAGNDPTTMGTQDSHGPTCSMPIGPDCISVTRTATAVVQRDGGPGDHEITADSYSFDNGSLNLNGSGPVATHRHTCDSYLLRSAMATVVRRDSIPFTSPTRRSGLRPSTRVRAVPNLDAAGQQHDQGLY